MIDSKIINEYKEMKKQIVKFSKEEYRDILANHLIAILEYEQETHIDDMSDETCFLTELIELFCIDKIYQLDNTENKE